MLVCDRICVYGPIERSGITERLDKRIGKRL